MERIAAHSNATTRLKTPRLLLVISAVSVMVVLLMVSVGPIKASEVTSLLPPSTLADSGPTPSRTRIIVLLNTDISEQILTDLWSYGVIHGWIDRRRLVAMTPHGNEREQIEALSYVDSVVNDRPVYLTSVGTWARDMIDVTDVEESGIVGDPDAREVEQTGAGVHVIMIDSGLSLNWRDFLDESRVNTTLARSFVGGDNLDPLTPVCVSSIECNAFHSADPTNLWEHDTHGHGTATASFIIGFKTDSVVVDGVAPGATVIPLKITQQGTLFGGGSSGFSWTSQAFAALDYAIGLVQSGTIGPTVITMVFGFTVPLPFEEDLVNEAIAAGIILVGAAGNEGESGMIWPGAYPQVISAGAVGWTEQFRPGTPQEPNRDFWWTLDVGFDPDSRRGPFEDSQAFVAGFSGRAIPNLVPGFPQELDVLAPGFNNVSPFTRLTGLVMGSGTSISTPLTAGVAALMLEKNPTLVQSEVEAILKSTALPMAPNDSRPGVISPFRGTEQTFRWDDDCFGTPCDPVGAGLLQADAALAATPKPRRK